MREFRIQSDVIRPAPIDLGLSACPYSSPLSQTRSRDFAVLLLEESSYVYDGQWDIEKIFAGKERCRL